MIQENLFDHEASCDAEDGSRTINDFLGRCMKEIMDELYETMSLRLIEENYISMKNYYVDGTKIEANANKYSFVWKKATVGFEEKLKEEFR